MSTPETPTPDQHYESIREAGVLALEEGRHQEALDHFREALCVAEGGADRERIHAARCNVSLALWQMGEQEQAKQGLREIILASGKDQTVAAAALWLSAILSKEQNYEKSLQYLGIARERAEDAGDWKLQTSALIEIGNLHLACGESELSLEEYRAAIEMLQDQEDAFFERAHCRKNEGYVLALLGRFKESFEALRQAREISEREGYPWILACTLQDQAYAFLLRNHLRRAEKAALRAATVSRDHAYLEVMKNAYFILMEVAIRQDESAKFDRYFDKLQELMPEVRLSRSFFRMFDITDILNLREA